MREPAAGPAACFPSIGRNDGKPVPEWRAPIRARRPARRMERARFLKDEHGKGHRHASTLVAATLAAGRGGAFNCRYSVMSA